MGEAKKNNDQAKACQESRVDVEDDFVEDILKTAQDGVLRGARRLQKSYRSLIRGNISESMKDSHLLAFGAGVGAGVGLGAALLLGLHPLGRAAAVVAGAAGGAMLSTAVDDEKKKQRVNDGEPVSDDVL
jgi:hypothetical protein